MSFTDHPLLERQALDIPTLIMNAGNQAIALPAMSVAEIVTDLKPRAIKGGPDWLIGEVIWRERAVPLIDLDVLSIGVKSARNVGEPIAVLNGVGGSDHYQFLAIRIREIPALRRLTEDDVEAVENQTLPGMKLAVMIDGKQYWIPDLLELEMTWLSYVEMLAGKS